MALGTLVLTTVLAGACHPRPPAAARADAGAASEGGAPTVVVADGPTGTIEGTVTLSGPLPPLQPIAIDAATGRVRGCADAAREFYASPYPVTQPGPLPSAAVVAEVHSGVAPPGRRRQVDFHDCSITPRFVVMSLADTLALHAATTEYHLPKVEGLGATIAQLLQPTEDQEKHPVHPGRYIIHSVNFPNWMQTPLYVIPNGYYDQTDAQGHYRIERVPVGTVTIHAWFMGSRPVDATVTVQPGQTSHQDFTIAPAPAAPPAPAPGAGAPDAAFVGPT